MKIRQGFITNSSSSSFIIAIRNDVSENDLEQLLKNKLTLHIKQTMDDYGLDDDENYIKEVLESIKTNILTNDGMICDDYRISSLYGSNEDGIESCVIYDHLHKIQDNERIKILEC